MKAAGSDPLPADYLPELRDQISPWLKILGLFPGDVVDELAIAMVDFLHDRKLDEQSRTAGFLKRDLVELASGSGIDGKLTIMDEFVLGVFFGKMPGASVELSIDGDGQHRRVLPDDDALLGAAFRTLSRLGDDGVPSTGLVYRRRVETITDRIPPDASPGDLADFVAGLVTIVLEGSGTQALKRRRIGLIADRLVAIGSLGNVSVSSALDTHFAGLDLPGQAACIGEIALPCLEEAYAKDLSQALVHRIFEESLDHVSPSERRPVLKLFARCFPDALAGFAGVLAEQIDCHYRLEDDARSARRDARRWHDAHAGWKLIDAVLEIVWPDAGKGMEPRQRDAVVEIVRAIIAFFGGGGDRSGPAGKKAAKRGSRTRRQRTDEGLESVDVANVANVSVNGEHVAVLASLRSAIHKLDTVLHVLDRRALFELEPNFRTDPEARKELGELRGTIGAVQSWRNQLDEKRQRGDYERNAQSEPRAVGPRIVLPRLPQVKAEGLAANEAAIRKIVAAAQVLVPHIF